MTSPLDTLTIRGCIRAMERGQTSAVELTEATLKAIEDKNPSINAYITLNPDEAIAQARAADQARLQGRAGALAGVPIALKDILVTRGLRTTAASRMLADFVPPYDGTVVRKLREAGGVFLC